jgi:hypothetical protein
MVFLRRDLTVLAGTVQDWGIKTDTQTFKHQDHSSTMITTLLDNVQRRNIRNDSMYFNI